MNDDEEFYAWLDGELDPKSAARMEARVARDPALAELAIQHRAMTKGLRMAFDPLLANGTMPPRSDGADVIDLKSRRKSQSKPPFGVAQWAAMAATLMLGLIAGTILQPNGSGTVESRDGRLYAAASLDQALERQLASRSTTSEDVRIGMTFRATNGRTCRSFSGMAGQGLACRDDSGWVIEGLFASPPEQREYRMAAGEDPRVNDMIDRLIVGEPFEAKREADAQKRNWR